LYARELLHAPMFYLSEYLEANRQEYYDRLLAVSSDDDWTGWCEFFLQALERQAKENEAKTRRVLALYEEKKDWMVQATHSQYAIAALDYFFSYPVFSSSHFVSESSDPAPPRSFKMGGSQLVVFEGRIPAPTARRVLKLCHKHGLLKKIRGARGRRPAVFAFPELLDIVEG